MPPREVRDLAPAPVGTTAEPLPGLSVVVEGVRRTRTRAAGPGELDGAPGAAVTVVVTNRGSAAADLGTLIVDLATGPDQRPASPSDGAEARPFPPVLAPGARATGTAVFAVPEGTDAVRVLVRLRGGTPAAVFDGRLA